MAFPYHYGNNNQAPPPPPPPPSSTGQQQQPQHAAPGVYGVTSRLGYNYSYGYGQQQQSPVVGYGYHYSNSGGTSLAAPTKPVSSTAVNPQAAAQTATAPIISETTKVSTEQKSQWHCDSCKLDFDSEKAWKSHRKSHVKCSDCDFEGAPKIVKAHYQAVHGKFSGSGFKTVTVSIPGCRVQKFKICVGNRPEDIQRWIAERKKRFPRTSSRAAAAAAATTYATTGVPGRTDSQHTNAANSAIEKDASPAEAEKGGLSMLLAGYGSSDDSDNDCEPSKEQTPQNETVEQQTTTTTTIDEEVQSRPEIAVSTEPEKASTLRTRSCRFFFRNGSCRNGEACRFSHEIPPPARDSNSNSSNRQNNNNINNRKRKRGGHTSSDTLLRKLLENDMDRESTLTMQLLKYIVGNNYFMGDGAANSATANS